MFPMLRRKVVKCLESLSVFFQAGDGFIVFELVFCTEEIKGFSSINFGVRHPDFMQISLGLCLQGFGHFIEYICGLVNLSADR